MGYVSSLDCNRIDVRSVSRNYFIWESCSHSHVKFVKSCLCFCSHLTWSVQMICERCGGVSLVPRITGWTQMQISKKLAKKLLQFHLLLRSKIQPVFSFFLINWPEMDGWKMKFIEISFWGVSAYFQGRFDVSFREFFSIPPQSFFTAPERWFRFGAGDPAKCIWWVLGCAWLVLSIHRLLCHPYIFVGWFLSPVIQEKEL